MVTNGRRTVHWPEVISSVMNFVAIARISKADDVPISHCWLLWSVVAVAGAVLVMLERTPRIELENKWGSSNSRYNLNPDELVI